MTLTHAEYKAIANNIRPNGQAFIDGKFCDAADGEKFETTNPATGQVLANVALIGLFAISGFSGQASGRLFGVF